jgi:hypothetical protein
VYFVCLVVVSNEAKKEGLLTRNMCLFFFLFLSILILDSFDLTMEKTKKSRTEWDKWSWSCDRGSDVFVCWFKDDDDVVLFQGCFSSSKSSRTACHVLISTVNIDFT